jgi:hypothetical protein
LKEGIPSRPEIDRFIDDGEMSFPGEAKDIRSATKFWTHDKSAMHADQPGDKEEVHPVLQGDRMGDQKFHGKTTVLKIDDLSRFS